MPGRTLFPYTTLFRSELVDLVAEEIVTYHTEIAKRQERIEALTSEVGNRYSYSNMIGKSKPMQERSEEHTSELQSQSNLVCRLLLEKKQPPVNTPIQR